MSDLSTYGVLVDFGHSQAHRCKETTCACPALLVQGDMASPHDSLDLHLHHHTAVKASHSQSIVSTSEYFPVACSRAMKGSASLVLPSVHSPHAKKKENRIPDERRKKKLPNVPSLYGGGIISREEYSALRPKRECTIRTQVFAPAVVEQIIRHFWSNISAQVDWLHCDKNLLTEYSVPYLPRAY